MPAKPYAAISISTHAPAGGATVRSAALYVHGAFLLTPLREGRRYESLRARQAAYYFYSRPCGRGDISFTLGLIPNTRFLLTPLREGRLGSMLPASAKVTKFLLTPLREGRRTGSAYHRDPGCISTHAPAGGATTGSSRTGCKEPYFYSRPCGRGDLAESSSSPLYSVNISTHAPAGGATIPVIPNRRLSTYFYSRPCGRGDS